MALRVGIDMDGTIADFTSAFHEVERRLLGERLSPDSTEPTDADDAEREDGEASDAKRTLKAATQAARERELIWDSIRETRDFWLGLRPLEPGVIRLIHEVSFKHDWEVFFLTQRPRTAGQTVQRQTQQWLVREGFEAPSVLTLRGGRGRAAAALELDVLIDDTPKNCVDVVSDSTCRPILVLRAPSKVPEAAAKRLGIGVTRSVSDAIRLLEQSQGQLRTDRPGFVQRILGSFGRP